MVTVLLGLGTKTTWLGVMLWVEITTLSHFTYVTCVTALTYINLLQQHNLKKEITLDSWSHTGFEPREETLYDPSDHPDSVQQDRTN